VTGTTSKKLLVARNMRRGSRSGGQQRGLVVGTPGEQRVAVQSDE
jgi:hypothetical protein